MRKLVGWVIILIQRGLCLEDCCPVKNHGHVFVKCKLKFYVSKIGLEDSNFDLFGFIYVFDIFIPTFVQLHSNCRRHSKVLADIN